jgi:hypothetical protein
MVERLCRLITTYMFIQYPYGAEKPSGAEEKIDVVLMISVIILIGCCVHSRIHKVLTLIEKPLGRSIRILFIQI